MIDTLDNVKTSLLISGEGDDPLLTRLLSGADAYITEFTGRVFTGGTFTETHPAGRTAVFLRNYPVASVTSLKVDAARQFGDGTARAADSFVVHADRGVIESVAGPFLPRGHWPGALQVVYTTATGQVPGAIKEAFSQIVGQWYRSAKTSADQEFQMLGERETESGRKAWSWGLPGGLKLPPGVMELLQPYRVPAA